MRNQRVELVQDPEPKVWAVYVQGTFGSVVRYWDNNPYSLAGRRRGDVERLKMLLDHLSRNEIIDEADHDALLGSMKEIFGKIEVESCTLRIDRSEILMFNRKAIESSVH